MFSLLSACLVAVALVALAIPSIHAQSFDASTLHAPTELSMPWLMHAGDDPSFARPDLDDSRWTVFDPRRPLTLNFPRSKPRIVWYRLHIRLAPGQRNLAIEETTLARAFEVYANGQRILTSGSFAPLRPYTFAASLIAPLPPPNPADNTVFLAVRVYIWPDEWAATSYPGLYARNLILGDEVALRDQLALHVFSALTFHGVYVLLAVCVGITALALFLAQRSRREYLWIVLLSLLSISSFAMTLHEYFVNVPQIWSLFGDLMEGFGIAVQIGMVASLLRFRGSPWQRIAFLASTILWALGALGGELGLIAAGIRILMWMPILLIGYLAIPILLIVRLRRGNREAGILLIPVILWSANIYLQVTAFFISLVPRWSEDAARLLLRFSQLSLGPLTFSLGDVCNLFWWISLGAILIWRSNRISREQTRLEDEMEAARQVQQVIVPENSAQIPGYQFDAVYRPASQVGGDFYQVIPVPGGGLLLVLGDVSGKGLPAAMLVAVVVGAIRTLASFTTDPALILSELNSRLIGRSAGGFTTCLALRIDANGRTTWANAGHLPPYLNSRPLESPGTLPLGIAPAQSYESSSFYLAEGDSLTCISDGVVEAQNSHGQLLGFEHTQQMAGQPALAIANVAQSFGQHDDITVIRIVREPALATVA
jgi:hypothetical protein